MHSTFASLFTYTRQILSILPRHKQTRLVHIKSLWSIQRQDFILTKASRLTKHYFNAKYAITTVKNDRFEKSCYTHGILSHSGLEIRGNGGNNGLINNSKNTYGKSALRVKCSDSILWSLHLQFESTQFPFLNGDSSSKNMFGQIFKSLYSVENRYFVVILWKKYTSSPRYWYMSIGQY